MNNSTEQLLVERRKTHGEYAHHAGVTQALMRVMQATPNWATLPDIIKESLHMNAHKVARVLTGNPYLHDHYDDVAGYAKLIPQRTEDGVGLLPEYAAIAALYDSAAAALAPTEKLSFSFAVEGDCHNQAKAALVIHVETLAAAVAAGTHSYVDFYRGVARRAGVPYAEAKVAAQALGYGKNGKKMRSRVRG